MVIPFELLFELLIIKDLTIKVRSLVVPKQRPLLIIVEVKLNSGQVVVAQLRQTFLEVHLLFQLT